MSFTVFLGLLGVSALGLWVYYGKNHRFFTGVILTSLQGICAFFAVNAIGSFFGVHIGANPFTIAVSGLGGAPGVVLLLLLNTLAGV